ncbi:MAG TPA: hypothetical protein VG892_14630 [Terriglobales bacterium]|jgi:hypothetical protein|nr:hypothetical protein [Terriglobales bacterium]
MRSELVTFANDAVPNRFLLCHITSAATQTLHRNSSSVHQTINNALKLIGEEKVRGSVEKVPVAEPAVELAVAL